MFLGAALPLTKTFVQSEGVLTASPYPHVSRVTSFHEQASGLQDFKGLLEAHARKNHCLFNGHLKAPLTRESRAGKTDVRPREWVVFDFDKVEAEDAAEVVRRYLPAECQQVSYIAQLSASMFRPDVNLWSGHIFMLLKQPIEAPRLRQWFETLNFQLPALEQQLRLSDSLQALHWPLDRTVAYDSKLIYIAPPKCVGFQPAIQQHITLVKKKQPALTIPSFLPIDQTTIRQKINQLRRSQGLDEISYNIRLFDGHEVLEECDVHSIEGIKTSGDHYIRFNLNGGDSYAYFIDLRAPELIRNFKGEPYLKTAEAAPDLWKRLRVLAPQALRKQPLEDSAEVLAFYASNQSSAIKFGTFAPTSRRLTLYNGTVDSAKAWLDEYGLVRPGRLPHYNLIFDPKSDVQFMPGLTAINTFRATDYMTRERTVSQPSTLRDLPTLTNKILRSMLGDPDDAVLAHFINWLAYIFQTRQKAETAWVLHGRTGTGKGSFIRNILTPLFGPEHVRTVQFGLVMTDFNAFLENTLFVVFEETDVDAVENNAELMTKLRHYVTDSPIEINQKGVKTYPSENYSNFFFLANSKKPVVITEDDRRFNLPNRQDIPIQLTPNELKSLFDGVELDAFADVLQRWPVDAMAAHRIIETEARANVHEASTSVNQLIAEAIQAGNLQFFIDRTPSDAEATADFFNRFNPVGTFKAQIDSYIEAAIAGETMILPEEQLFFLFRTLIPNTQYFQDSKTWRKRHFKSLGLDVDKQHRAPGQWDARARGVKVTWQLPAGITRPDASGKVTPLKNARRKS